MSLAVVGAGPAGLIAAETLAAAGHAVTVFDHMPSPARKFLIAGRGGLNLTHSEALEPFLDRYGAARPRLEQAIRAFPPEALVAWCEALGQPTFVGSSGRVFPRAMKASPLLRAWLRRLAGLGVVLAPRHRLVGVSPQGTLRFATPGGEAALTPDATVLALGGASWPRLGSDGSWPALLPGVPVAPLLPANMGFRVAWSEHFSSRFAGQPLKRIAARFGPATVPGEAMLTEAGIEGGAVYALSAPLRDAIAAEGAATLHLDLAPGRSLGLDGPARGKSTSNRLRRAGLSPAAIGLVQEALHGGAAPALETLVHALPVRLEAPMPIDRAISSAGGVAWESVGEDFALRGYQGVFVAGEMLDWEAPTGGYLLQACFATGVAAAKGALSRVAAAGP
jgi:uncharacterized flavoprotein (TIGR03862 family)